MATPDTPYLTQHWSGLTHYICPHCGYNTFDQRTLPAHRCVPVPEPLPDVAPPATALPPAAPSAPEQEG